MLGVFKVTGLMLGVFKVTGLMLGVFKGLSSLKATEGFFAALRQLELLKCRESLDVDWKELQNGDGTLYACLAEKSVIRDGMRPK
jgi:hypothetical protein